MDNTRQTRLKQFFSMQFLVIFILHIQRPKCSVVASSRKVIIATFRRGTETRMEKEREKKRRERRAAKEGWPEGLIFSHFSTGAMRFYGTGSIIPSNITRNCILE